MAKLTVDVIVNDLWERPGLSPRDRSVITVAALIARNHTIGLPHYFTLALDHGVSPGELSEIVLQMAFYECWSHAFFAVAVLKGIFEQRGIGRDQLPATEPELLPLDLPADEPRASAVRQTIAPVSEPLARYTDEVLFHCSTTSGDGPDFRRGTGRSSP